jgi:hypothetical protein
MHVSSRSPCRPAQVGAWPHLCAWAVVIAPGSPSDSRASAAAAAETLIKRRIEVSSSGCQVRSARSNDVRWPCRFPILRTCARCAAPLSANFAYIAGVARAMPAVSPVLSSGGHARATATLLLPPRARRFRQSTPSKRNARPKRLVPDAQMSLCTQCHAPPAPGTQAVFNRSPLFRDAPRMAPRRVRWSCVCFPAIDAAARRHLGMASSPAVVPTEIGSGFVLERERDTRTECSDLAVLHSHIHFRDLGHAQITK